MSCRATREWLHRDAVSLDEAQRLQLDDHLAACTDCRGDRERLRLVREVGTALPVPPAGAREYSRAIARALLEGAPSREPARRPRFVWLVPLAIGGIAAAAVATAVVMREEPAKQVVKPVPPPVVDKPIVDKPIVDKPVVEDVLAANVHVYVEQATSGRLGSMQVAIAADSELTWSPQQKAIVLDEGRIEIDASSEVRVVTERFAIELTDANVTVEPTGVNVKRGTVRVTDPSRKLLAQLEAGSQWQPAEPATHKAKLTKTPPKLADARKQLAAGQHAEAERTTEALLARSLTRTDEAEARMFHADLAQAMGNLAIASSRYEAVATKFSDLPAAESALYAAARIEARQKHDDAARALYDRYLANYPNGRYADDVRRQRRLK
jgi:hypothetical protein